MFVVDDIILSPVKGFLWIVRELQAAAEREAKAEADSLTQRLSTLYMQLEAGMITAEEFDKAEREVLDRLDALGGEDAEDSTDEDDADDQDEDADDGDDLGDDADEPEDDEDTP